MVNIGLYLAAIGSLMRLDNSRLKALVFISGNENNSHPNLTVVEAWIAFTLILFYPS